MKITIFWTGYVWLVTWTCLAEIWHDVICVDIDEKKISNLKQWIIPIYEPWLDELVKRNYNEKRLDFTTDAKMAIDFSNVIFSAVWTPPDKENAHKADLKFVKQIATTIWQNMNSYKVLINKSLSLLFRINQGRILRYKTIHANQWIISFNCCN